MSAQANDDRLTREDLQYLRIAIIFAKSYPDAVNMPKTVAALEVLYDKIERMYVKEANKNE